MKNILNAMKNVIFYSQRVKISEKQTYNQILRVAKLQCNKKHLFWRSSNEIPREIIHADSHQDPPLSALISSRPITISKFYEFSGLG